ncbi:MAG: aspartate-semialdehyde dehydrogenase [Deltaproteobacteria bacterium]|nr:aspartate-semialdehyde dehydrogenase [Deltaproteobacteria bacterium]MBI3296357.1 aspartate-semialdehyde dehydrogenase [Deltaproteobacteria bacterium]
MSFQSLEGIQSLALVGATGIVGREFLSILNDNRIKIPRLKLLASELSVGSTLEVAETELYVEELNEASFDGVEAAFFSAPANVTREYVPRAVEAGAIVVDDSSCFRLERGVPLIIPEINGALLKDFEGRIISTPNCAATPIAMALKPLQERYGIRRVVATTFQSVSGAGRKAVDELSAQTAALLNGKTSPTEVFPHRIAFNCLPLIGPALDNGDSDEETKVVKELRKILELPSLLVSATCVRVPTFCGHGVSLNVELMKEPDTLDVVSELLDSFAGVRVVDKPSGGIYATNVEASGGDDVFVSRIRRDYSLSNGLNMWVMTDNLRKGAALNALQILDTLYTYRRMS